MAEFIESLEDWQGERSVIDCNKFMLQNQINCDVTFLLGLKRESIPAHKYMLVSRSSVFQSIFCGTIAEDRTDTIPVSDIEPEIFRSMLLFLYTEQATVTNSNVKDLLYAAKKYAVKGLVNKCLNFLESSINTQNVCSILEMIHLYDGKSLESRCISYIHEHAKEVLHSRTFYNLCPSCVEQIVKSDEMIVDEKLVLEAVLKWSEHECKRRNLEVNDENQRLVMGHTLFLIRFPLLDSVYFTNSMSSRELLNHQEIIAMFQYFNGREQPSNWKFSCTRRRGFSLHSLTRYSFISMEGFPRHNPDEKDFIRFSSSENILLHGVTVYGSLDDNGDYDTRVELCCDSEKSVLDSNFTRISTTRRQHMYEAMFSKPILIRAGKSHTVSVDMKGPPTKLGYGGKSDCISEGVVFHFMNKSDCRTTVEKGQIPGLLFTLPAKQGKK